MWSRGVRGPVVGPSAAGPLSDGEGAGAEVDPGVVLMLAVQAGDADAFEELVRTYERPIFAVLRRMLGPAAPVEDLAQEAFLRVWRARDRFEPRGKLLTWLYRITWNLAANHVRTQKRKPLRALPQDPDGGVLEPEDLSEHRPDTLPASGDWAELVEWGLSELPENQRAALVFQHYDGLELAAIGDILEISPKATKSLLHRARENLRALLTPYREAEND